jgi:hypothetical protein
MLYLSCLQCSEGKACNVKEEIKTSVADSNRQHNHDTTDCGSFCTCPCCVHIVSVNFQPYKISIEKLSDRNKLHFFYDNISLPSNYFGNIWQPPKFI